MLFGLFCMAVVQLVALVVLVAHLTTLGADLQILQQKVDSMSTAQDQVAQDIATIKGQVATMAAAYATAAAAAQSKALADAKAAWEADDEAKWSQAHADLSGVISALGAGQPITPPATAADPSPAPVPAPSAGA